MFKTLKKIIRETENPTTASSYIFSNLQDSINKLEKVTITDVSTLRETNCLNLPLHKKKAILFTVAKIPIAASRAYSDTNIKKGFVLNGQLDYEHKLLPSLDNCLNTFRGNIGGTCLENKKVLVEYGAGYFVERNCEDAEGFFDRKVKFLSERTGQLEMTIRQKREQLAQVIQIYQMKVKMAAEQAGSQASQ